MTGMELGRALFKRGGELLGETIKKYLAGELVPIEQNHENATFTKKLSKEDGLIDLADDPVKNYRKIKAYAEWPGTYFFAKKSDSSTPLGTRNIRVIIKKARLENDALVIERVVPEGKKEMDYSAFLSSL
jgi:methionyl-tRNA formyltransferase